MDTSIVADSSIINYYAPYKAKLEAAMNRIIGYAEGPITRNRNAPESLMGNFFADALLWKGKQLDQEVQASFATKDGIRADLHAGDITVGNIFEVMPFENAVCILTLSGGDMLRLADYMVKTGGQPVGGIELVIENGKAKEFLVEGKPIDPDAHYKLATYDYLANGGDYVTFFDKPIAREDYTQLLRETLMQYVSGITKQGKHVQAQLDGRIQIIK
ncbi:5'-nucleotidase C-terminal domain-containing protein [Sphingobacterium sp. DN00404]|uniref:5'-nucleotidase C-terminal domain-containing protein n=1 Tax=Sphingobacterium micropteri TaxID=2763501 RepID=A0ABR7YJ45_9SPHI|nr:5'-nucleotidase C-terminal domain-containing protein [Sphingobacterium micropteri]